MVKKLFKKHRKSLPIYNYKKEIIERIKNHQALVLIGETGSGKTTQLVQYIYENGLHGQLQVAITQPRRIAALSVAKRVAQEQQVELGSTIGYSIRFESKTSSNTKVKFLTDGMLIREALLDPQLSSYSIIIIDEAHERSVNTDILLGLLRDLLNVRKDLKVIVMSATIEAKRFAAFFTCKNILEVKGRSYEVSNFFARDSEPDYIDASIIAIIQLHLECDPGDILVFLSGQEEIDNIQDILKRKRKLLPPGSLDFSVHPIYAALPNHMQMKAFEPSAANTRKIILATNIAETSITIPGIKYVIDSGVVKERYYDPSTGMESLKVVKISKAAARQRSGRAGRESAGKCYRLYSSTDYNAMEEYSKPEIMRNNLSSVVLQLKIMQKDARYFMFLDKPEDLYIETAYNELKRLGAIDKQENITTLGRNIAELPLPPILGRILLASLEPSLQCTKDILTIISLLCIENLCYFHDSDQNAMKVFKANEGDHITLLKIYNEWKKNNNKQWCKGYGINLMSIKRAKMIRSQLKQYLKKYQPVWKRCSSDVILKCLARGYYYNSAFLHSDNIHYKTYKAKDIVYIHPTSVLFQSKHKPQSIIFSELIVTTKKYVRTVSEADPSLLESLFKSHL
jgi:HrpA-like RNA helicase